MSETESVQTSAEPMSTNGESTNEVEQLVGRTEDTGTISTPVVLPVALFLSTLVLAGLLIANASTETMWAPAAAAASAMLPYCLYIVNLTWRGEARVTEHLLDSPYFLGFILTLLSLTISLSGFSGTEPGELIPGIGSAVFTTIVGLVFRFLVVSIAYKRSLVERDIAALEAELRDSAKGFASSQRTLIEALDYFASRRQELFDAEEIAWSRLNKSINEAAAGLDTELGHFTESLSSASTDAASSLNGTTESLAAMKTSIAQLAQATEQIAEAGRLDALGSHLKDMGSRASELSKQFSDLRSTLETMGTPARQATEDLKSIDRMLDDFIAIIEKHLK